MSEPVLPLRESDILRVLRRFLAPELAKRATAEIAGERSVLRPPPEDEPIPEHVMAQVVRLRKRRGD